MCVDFLYVVFNILYYVNIGGQPLSTDIFVFVRVLFLVILFFYCLVSFGNKYYLNLIVSKIDLELSTEISVLSPVSQKKWVKNDGCLRVGYVFDVWARR